MLKNNPVIIRAEEKIGFLDADADDEFLFSCFFDHPAHGRINDCDSPEMILSGRTGAGKTAIIRMITKNHGNSAKISLQDMAMDYIANSDIMNFLVSIDADVDLLFQILWKHVLCIEIIRLYFKVENESDSLRTFNQIKDFILQDRSKKRALDYLEKWNKKFWVTIDETLMEVAAKYESKIQAEFGVELIDKAKTNAGFGRTLSDEKRQSYQNRVKSIIDSSQLADLSKVMEALHSVIDRNQKKKFYIFIDNFDDRWADERIKYKLIASLIHSLPKFKKIQNLKIVASLRVDVIEKALLEDRVPGFQQDKLDDLQLKIRWTEKQLKELVNKRINFLFRRKYTKENVCFEDIFPSKIHNKDTFKYLVDRTFLRPREIIDFVNNALSAAEGKSSISVSNFRDAEREYSFTRLAACKDEWRLVYPCADVLIENLPGIKASFTVKELSESKTIENICDCIFDSNFNSPDPLQEYVSNYVKDVKGNIINLTSEVISVLYKIGILGIKTNKDDRLRFSHIDKAEISPRTLTEEHRIGVHKMFHIALGLGSSRGE